MINTRDDIPSAIHDKARPRCICCGGVVMQEQGGGVCMPCWLDETSEDMILEKARDILCKKPKEDRNATIKRMHERGFTVVEISRVSGLSRTHVYEILRS